MGGLLDPEGRTFCDSSQGVKFANSAIGRPGMEKPPGPGAWSGRSWGYFDRSQDQVKPIPLLNPFVKMTFRKPMACASPMSSPCPIW